MEWATKNSFLCNQGFVLQTSYFDGNTLMYCSVCVHIYIYLSIYLLWIMLPYDLERKFISSASVEKSRATLSSLATAQPQP